MQVASPHAHLSNRAKVRLALDRRPVFKNVLENPFEVTWPSVPVNIRNAVLACLVGALENVTSRNVSGKLPQKMSISEDQSSGTRALEQRASHIVVGINAVTRALERQLSAARKRLVPASHDVHNRDQSEVPSPIAVVFACSADVDPPALIAHIPHLVAGCNSMKNVTEPIRLVPLPKDSELTIAQILGVRRAAVLALCRGSILSETVRNIIDSIPIVRAPWLCPPDTQGTGQLMPTHIKQLRTTAPKDMKSAREQRSKGRAAARKSVSSLSRPVRRKPRMTLTTENAM